MPKRLLMVIIGLLLLVGVSWLTLSRTTPGRLMQLDWAESRWNTAAPQHYAFTLRHISFATVNQLYPIRIEVADGRVITCMRLDLQQPIDPIIIADYATIPTIFAQLRMIIRTNPDTFSLHTDGRTGVPSEIRFDFSRSSTDDDHTITITDFALLP